MENTDAIVLCVQTQGGCWSAEKGGRERGGRQIKDPKKSRVKREAGKGGNQMKQSRCERNAREAWKEIKDKKEEGRKRNRGKK